MNTSRILQITVLLSVFVFAPSFAAAQLVLEDPFVLCMPAFPSVDHEYEFANAGGESSCRGWTHTHFRVAESEATGFADLFFRGSYGGYWYRTEKDQVFSFASIANAEHELWGNEASYETSIQVPKNEGIWLGALFPSIDTARNSFGWVQLLVDDDLNVTMPDSAIAPDATRITIGQNLVPDANPKVVEDIGFTFEGDRFPNPALITNATLSDVMQFQLDSAPTDGFATVRMTTTSTTSDWYLAEYGDVFSRASIVKGDHEFFGPEWGEQQPFTPDFPAQRSFEVPIGEDVWLGVNTGIDLTGHLGSLTELLEYFPDRELFGWVQLVIDENLDVTIVDNAIAFDADQIIIGRNLVPEPSSNSFALLATFILLAYRTGVR